MKHERVISYAKGRVLPALSSLLLILGASGVPTPPAHAAPAEAGLRPAADAEAVGELPMRFEPNAGRTDGRVKFLARGQGYGLFLTPDEVVLALRGADPVRVRFAGATGAAAVEGEAPLAGTTNYLVGDDPAAWRTNVTNYGKVRYRGLYDGVDAVFYGNGRQLEFDFVVAPGADPHAVRLAYQGVSKVEVASDGDLVLTTRGGELRQKAPVAYQRTAAGLRPVASKYRVAAGEVGFEIGAYDPALPLVIDPFLSYSTYLGGTDVDSGRAIAVDALGNIYVAGSTLSLDFPTASPFQGDTPGSGKDAFVSKIAPSGNALVYSTYLGGGNEDEAEGLALGASGNVYVIGTTASTDFPTVAPVQANSGGQRDVFVAVLNAAGSALTYATYLGGGGEDYGADIALDASGNMYLTGRTASVNFPTMNPIQTDSGDNADDAFATKLNAAGSTLVYSTYLAGNLVDAGRDVAVTPGGEAFIFGDTSSTTFATRDAIQNMLSGPSDLFLVHLNPTATQLVSSTYLGGTGTEVAGGIVLDNAGNAYITGTTGSTDFPTMNPIQLNSGGDEDAFVAKLGDRGTSITYSTYLGGSRNDAGRAIALESNGAVHVVGDTGSSNFPTVQPIQTNPGDMNRDVFVTRVNQAGTGFAFSTYLGGNARDEGCDIALDESGNVYVTGDTRSANFPTQSPLGLNPDGDMPDAFVTRIGDAEADVAITKTGTPDPVPSGTEATYTITVTNAGTNPAGNVVVTDPTPAGTTFASATTSQGTFTSPAVGGTGDVTFALGMLAPGATATITLVLTVTAAEGATVTNTATVRTSALDTNTANDTASVTATVSTPVTPPTISGVERLTQPFRVRISGDNFQQGAQVFIGDDATPWPNVTYKSAMRLTLKRGAELKAKFPKGVPVQIRVVNPDGGQAIATFTR
jgi:uncharacterized repeat protein (TIGR01451 family)